jgi:hypothetical protein
MEVGRRHLERLASELSELCNVESPPKREGNTMVQILAPKKDGAAKKVVKKTGAAKKDGAAAKDGPARDSAAPKAGDAKKAAAPKKAEGAKKAAAPKKTEDAKETDGADRAALAAPPAETKAGEPAEAASAAGKNE